MVCSAMLRVLYPCRMKVANSKQSHYFIRLDASFTVAFVERAPRFLHRVWLARMRKMN